MSVLRILIAEDNPVVAKTLGISIEKLGHILIGTAMNGRQAFIMAESERPDIILMDVEMPEINGIEATRLILEKFEVPIIIVTSHGDRQTIREAGEAGAASFLLKPVTSGEIDRSISIALARFEDLKKLKKVNQELQETNEKLIAALEEVKILQGIIPICSECKDILDDKGAWEKIETYVEQNSDAHFSPGICPECAQNIQP